MDGSRLFSNRGGSNCRSSRLIMIKICSKCKLEKTDDSFHKRNDRKSGLRSKCIDCEVLYRNSIERQLPQKLIEYRSGAKRRGIDFSLTLEEFTSLWQEPCSYCGSEIETIGLDRIENNKSYSIDNVTTCCALCNVMKMALPKDVFIEHCIKITNKQKYYEHTI